MAEGDLIPIEVAYALPDEQLLLSLNVPEGTTVESAIEQSGILARFPEVDLNQNAVGIFGKVAKKSRVLESGDRVEIYRPLIADPKQMRRERAKSKAERQATAKSQSKRNRGASGSELEEG